MSSPELVLDVLRSELRSVGLTYKALAERIGMSESSVKRMFWQKDMTLTRLAQICKAAGISLEDVLRQAADVTPHSDTLTLTQESALVADLKLLLVAICCLGQWSFDQIIETYRITSAECVLKLTKLDKLGLIELRPLNRYRLNVSNAFHWQPDGPVQRFFREFVVSDYFNGRFDGPGEALRLIPARLSIHGAQIMAKKIQQLGVELAQLQESERRQFGSECDGFTLMLGFRSWEFSALTALRRQPQAPTLDQLPVHQVGPKKR